MSHLNKYQMENLERRFLAGSTVNTAKASTENSDGKRAGGYAALYNSESGDLGGFVEVIAPGAFTRSLASVATGDLNAFLFWQHDSKDILASTRSSTLVLSEDETGLAFDFDTDGMDEKQRKTLARGDLQVSFGFKTVKDQWEEREDGTILRTILDLDLIETSLVTFPAYSASSVAMRALDAFKAEAAPTIPADLDPTNRIALKLRALSKKLGYGERAMDTKQAEGFGIGDRVLIKNPHDPEQTMGTIKLISGDTPYGVVIDGMEEMGVHKWYIGEELEIIVEDESSDEDRKMKKKMPSMKMGKSH